MKFARTDLITRVEAEIARRLQAAEDRNAKLTQQHEKRRQEYIDRTAPAWKDLADRIRARLRNSQPVTAEDIPMPLRAGWSGGHVQTFDAGKPDTVIADTEHLTTLLHLLESAADEEITTASLARMGFRMAQLFRA